jgi:hypothetical protein
VALYCGIGSSSLNALVNAFDRLHMVLLMNGSMIYGFVLRFASVETAAVYRPRPRILGTARVVLFTVSVSPICRI